MDINELDSFNLGDAVKFHSKLNPKLWIHHKLDPEVREQLLIIAEDFVSTLGISDLDIVDITVSGSNAAYSYTPHSDLDLHVVVNIPKLHDEVYRELFTAKKTLYNDSHDITVHGVPVELYVQDVNEPVKSLGEYSVINDKWIHIPKRKRANFDEVSTKAKYENLSDIVDLALRSRDLDRIEKTIDTVRRYRKAGLARGGEFSPENLAFKAIRSQGGIDKLYDLRDMLRSEKLSIEEATSREDAILKIKKLQNTSGRTPAEISTINNVIDKLIHQYNIKPHEIEDQDMIYTDPLNAKMAAAAYEKAQAAAALKGEWNKFKGRFKDIFTEDELVTETTQQSQDINTASNYLARKILYYIKKNDRNILNYFKTHDEHSVILFSEKGRNLDFPPLGDKVLPRVLNYLTFEVTLNESLPEVPAENKVKPLGVYYPATNKIMISVPGIKMYSKYYNMSMVDSLSNTIAHEITHALDDAKSYSAALMPKGEYLKLPQEVNARFQEALMDISKNLLDNRKRIVSDMDHDSSMDYLKSLIKWSFGRNRLSGIYEINDPRYKRLVTRTYKFYEAELAKPEFQTISKTNLVQKALDWISNKTLEETQLDETVEENQTLNLVSKQLARNIIKELRAKNILGDLFTLSKKAQLRYYGIKVKDMNLPLVHDAIIDNVLDKMTLRIEYADSQVLGRYVSSENYMELNLYQIKNQAEEHNLPFAVELASVIAHELQHAIDDTKSKGKALLKPVNYDASQEQYLKLKHEINARLQQVLSDITYFIYERTKSDETSWAVKDLPILIEYLFSKHRLTKEVIQNDKQYNRLLSRTYKFFVAELNNPKKIDKHNLLKRAYNYIVGKPTSEIYENSNDIPNARKAKSYPYYTLDNLTENASDFPKLPTWDQYLHHRAWKPYYDQVNQYLREQNLYSHELFGRILDEGLRRLNHKRVFGEAVEFEPLSNKPILPILNYIQSHSIPTDQLNNGQIISLVYIQEINYAKQLNVEIEYQVTVESVTDDDIVVKRHNGKQEAISIFPLSNELVRRGTYVVMDDATAIATAIMFYTTRAEEDGWHVDVINVNKSIKEIHEASGYIPSVLYHATYRPLLANIKKTGLGGSGSQAKWEDSKPGVVYLATDPDVAISYAESSEMVPEDWLDEIIVLTIPTNSLDQSNLYIDSNVQDNEGDTVEYHGIIPFTARMLNEASGYIPSAKEKNDPRFKTALTVDVKPDSIKKNAKAFNWKTSRAGIPPQARPDGKITENSVVWKSATKFNNEQEELNHILNLKEDHRVKLELLESFARQQGNISEDLDNKVVDQVKALVNSFSSKNPTVGKNYIPVPITIFHGEVMFHDVKNNYPADTKARFGTLRQYSSTEVTFDIYGKLYSYFEAEYRKMTGATIILVENEEQYDKLRMQVQLVFEQTLPALEYHREEK